MLRVLLVLLLAVRLVAQGWVDVSPAVSPPAQDHPSMAFDESRGVTLMLNAACTETWIYNGTSWARQLPAHQIQASGRGSLAYVSSRQTVVACYYTANGAAFSEWNGTDWLALPSPGTPYAGLIAYDRLRDQIVFTPDSGPFATLLFSGSQWTVRVPRISPPTYGSIGDLFFDSTRNVCVLFHSGTSTIWNWDGFNWVQRFPTSWPLAFPSASQTQVAWSHLHSGVTIHPEVVNGQYYAPLNYQVSGDNFFRLYLTSNPSLRTAYALSYDSLRDTFVLFGGHSIFNGGQTLGDTWELSLGPVASYTSYGNGCQGARGTPILGSQWNTGPRVGLPFSLQISNLPWTGPAFLFFGFSDTNYGGQSLPFSLVGLGAPGCTLFASADVLIPVANILGVGAWSWSVPNLPGAVFFNQGIALDPTANSLGLTLSNAGRGVIGS